MDLPGFEKYTLKCQTIPKNKNFEEHQNVISNIQRREEKSVRKFR